MTTLYGKAMVYRRLLPIAATAMSAVLALVALTGCGGPNTEAYAADYKICESQFSEIRTDMKAIDSQLDSGISFREFEDKVNNLAAEHSAVNMAEVRASYDTLVAANPDAKRENACIGVGEDIETAYDAYSSAKSSWNDCIEDPYITDCNENETLNSELQDRWAEASTALDAADETWVRMKALAEGREPPTPSSAESEDA
jgi:hypothetical protein